MGALLSLFLLGIDELAVQMEEPFTILPMQAFCDKIGNWCNEIVSWTPGDNGMVIQDPAPMNYVVWNTDNGLPDGEPKDAVNGAVAEEKEEKSRLRRILGQ